MRICHVITRLIIGGAQENTLLSCQGLHERGHEVTLVIGPETGPEGSLIEQAQRAGYRLEVVNSLRRAVRPHRDAWARLAMAKLFRRLAPEVVHTHSSKAGILGRCAARAADVPVIVHTIHGMSFNRTQSLLTRSLYRRLEAYCAAFTHRIISVAEAMSRQAVAAGVAPAEKFTTVYSGMRTDLFDPDRPCRRAIRREWGMGESDVVVGAVARLFHNKGYEQLIPAMAIAVRSNPHLKFVWVGDGAQHEEYEKRLRDLGLRDRVFLTGLLPPEAVPGALAGMDLLVHASQWEGLPRAAVQALLMRVPVISFDIDGAPEVVIPGRTGMLVPLNDIEMLGATMSEMASDASVRRRLGQAGREWCLARFDWRHMVERLETVYAEAVTSNRHP